MQLRRLLRFGFTLLAVFSLVACSPPWLENNRSNHFKEQLYIDARLNFAIKHPLDWQRKTIPVSQPEYRADTVLWEIEVLEEQGTGVGSFLVRSTPADPQLTLPDLLSDFLSTMPELQSGQVETVAHPVGDALQLLGHDADRGRLTIALKGQRRDFIISLDYPSQRFTELLPIFEEIVASFTEISKPQASTQAAHDN